MSRPAANAWGGGGGAKKTPPAAILQAASKAAPATAAPPPQLKTSSSLNQASLRRAASGGGGGGGGGSSSRGGATAAAPQLRTSVSLNATSLRRSSTGGSSTGGGGGGKPNNQQRRNNPNSNNKSGSSLQQQAAAAGPAGGGGGGGGGNPSNKKGKQQQRNNSMNSGNNNNNANNSNGVRASDKSLSEIDLLHDCRSGPVIRHSASTFLQCRMKYLEQPPRGNAGAGAGGDTAAIPSCWTPHDRCLWQAPNRVEQIQEEMKRLWDFQPLALSETRWKPRREADSTDVPDEAEQMRRAFAILNKISWTTLDKLSIEFLKALTISGGSGEKGTNNSGKDTVLSKEVVHKCMALIVEKASMEPHFAELYAAFCSKITAIHKTFKRELLQVCQESFEKSDNDPDLPESMDPLAREFELKRAKAKSIGLMQFIGELYKMTFIKDVIMIGCLHKLLANYEEERLECFARLLTTVGRRLHENKDNGTEMKEIWRVVYSMAGKAENNGGDGPKAPSTRIKFLLQDLIELKDSGWVQKRPEEKARTIAEIHKEVAKEEEAAARRNNRMGGRQSSTGGMPSSRSSNPNLIAAGSTTPTKPDGDGFMQVAKNAKRVSFRRSQSDVAIAPKSSLQMAVQAESVSVNPVSTPNKTGPSAADSASQSSSPPQEQKASEKCLDPKECEEKAKKILNEYFVGGDTDDAVLSLSELVQVGQDGDIDRAAAVAGGGVLLVLEMKETEVQKFLVVMARCITEKIIQSESLIKGLNEPLEFLRDVEIDAPRAPTLLAMIVADWMKQDALTLSFLENAPEYFRSDGMPALFAGRVLSQRGGEVSDAELQVVANLMSSDEKKAHPAAKDFLDSLSL